MAVTCSDIIKVFFAIILPPLGVFLEVGCGRTLCYNVIFTLCGYLPGIVHAFYVIGKY